MREFNRYWSRRGRRMHLCVRWWGGRPLREFWAWITGRAHWYTRGHQPVKISLRTHTANQDRCYCPTGSTTSFRLEAFGVGGWGWLSRDWTPLPCVCDVVLAELERGQ